MFLPGTFSVTISPRCVTLLKDLPVLVAMNCTYLFAPVEEASLAMGCDITKALSYVTIFSAIATVCTSIFLSLTLISVSLRLSATSLAPKSCFLFSKVALRSS